ncbi:37S ribosomal protein S12 [Verticillium dahliae VDG2]|nr:37S ribosomal protein S12 [Verticillium dahliae VDG2]
MVKVLLTGGSGFIGGHILEQLLEQGHDAVVTVRSEDKAQKIRDDYKDLAAGRLTVAIVPDIAREDAFDEVVKSPGLEAVLHTASPFHFNFSNVCPLPRKPLCCCPPFLLTRALLLTAATADPKKDLIDPAVIGTTAILQALHRSAPGVKRVVITSSFASIIDEARVTDPTKIFTERDWNPVTEADMTQSKATAYRASKKLAERAAWDFVAAAAPAPTFDLVTICPPLIAAVVRENFPELADRLPGPEVEGGEFPPKDKVYGYDNTATNEILGIQWIGLEKSIVDSVKQLQSLPVWKTL